MKRRLVALLFCLFSPALLQATPNCSEGHCGRVHTELNKFCIANGMAGKPFMVFGPDGSPCYCPCSCVTPDTELDLADGRLSFASLELGHLALTPMASEQRAVAVEKKLVSQVQGAHLVELAFSNGSQLRVSDNHTFVGPAEKTVTASELKAGDTVLDGSMQEVAVVSTRLVSAYEGELMNIITRQASTKPEDHVVVTNGILSGDWLLQAASDSIATGVAIRSGVLSQEF